MMKVVLILSLLIALSFSATITWNGGGVATNRNFNNANNWAGGVAPTNLDIAVFDLSGAIGNVFVTSATTAVQEIQFLAGGNPVNLILQDTNAVGLTLTNITWSSNQASITVTSGCTLTVSQYAILNGINPININNVGGTVTINGIRATGANILSNTGTNNVIFATAANPTILTSSASSISFPATGFAYGTGALSIFTEGAGNGQLTFNYIPTLGGTWTVNNNIGIATINFNQGVTFSNGATITVSNNGGGQPRPTVLFQGIVTSNAVTTVDATPTFGTATFVGSALQFVDKNPSFSGNIAGTGPLTFSTSTFNTAAISVAVVTILNPSVTFTGPQWNFGSNTNPERIFAWNATYTFSQNWVLNSSFVVNFPLTIGGSFAITIPTTSTFTVYDGLTANIAYNFNNLNGQTPNFRCNLPSNTFAFGGTGALTFPAGFTVAGCTLSATNNLIVTGGAITTTAGNNNANTTLLPQGNGAGQIQFTTTTSFSGPAGLSLTLPGSWSTITGNDWVVNTANFEVIIGGTFTAVAGTNAVTGTGILTVAGNAMSFQGTNQACSVATLTFNNQAVTLSAGGILQFGSILYLRNTNLQGTSEIYFNSGSVRITKGSSTIANQNFRFKAGLTTIYSFDGVNPNTGAQLFINSGVTTVGGRIIEGTAITAVTNTQIVFNDIITFNTTNPAGFTIDGGNGGAAPLSGVTFLGSTTALQNGASVTFTNNIYLNATNNIWNGNGVFNVANNANIFLLGNWNPSSQTGTSTVNFAGPNINFRLSANVILGPNIVLPNGVNFLDTDGNDLVPAFTATVEGSRTINGQWIFGVNVIIGGNLIINSAQPQDNRNVGFLQVNGNSLQLGSGVALYNQLILTQATTISGAFTLTIGENDATVLPPHGFTVPTGGITLNSGTTLNFGDGNTNRYLVVTANGAISGTGTFNVNGATVSTSSATAISVPTQSYTSATLSGSGSFALTPTTQITFTGANFAFNTATVNSPFVVSAGGAAVTLTGFSFTAAPVTFQGAQNFVFADSRTINSNWIANVGLTFNNAVNLGANAAFSGTGTLTFTSSIVLGANLAIVTNPVVFGNTVTDNFVIVSGAFTLTLSNTATTIISRVVSGGANIVSTSPAGYVHKINAAGGLTSKGVMPPEWTWSNQIQLGLVNVTGSRTLTVPVQLTNNYETIFNDGVIINANGAITYDDVGNNQNSLRVERFFTTNTASIIPNNIITTISGPSFVFNGTTVLQINGTFFCQTQINFNTAVTFGYSGTTTNNLHIQPFCSFLNPAVPIQILRSSVVLDTDATYSPTTLAAQSLFIENSITFGLVPPLSTTISTTGTGQVSLLLRGNLIIAGNQFQITTTKVSLGSISITTLQNSTLQGINPSSSLTFISTNTPWVEPQVQFASAVNQVINLQGPIQLVNQAIGPQGAFFPSFPTTDARYPFARVAFVDSVSFSSGPPNNAPVFYSFNFPHQYYVSQPSNTFQFNLGNNFVQLGHAPSTFSKFGYGVPNVQLSTTASSFFSPSATLASTPASASKTGSVSLFINQNTRILTIKVSFTGLVGTSNAAQTFLRVNTNTNAVPFPTFPNGVQSGSFETTVDLNNPANFVTAFFNNNGGTAASAFNALLGLINAGSANFFISSTGGNTDNLSGTFPALAAQSPANFRTLYGNSPVGSSSTFGDITITDGVNVRLSSGSLTSTGKLTVNTNAALWVESPLTTQNLIFAQSTDRTKNSLFQYTFTSSNPTGGLVTSTNTFYAGNATVNIVNSVNVGTTFTAISSTNANSQNLFGAGGFNRLAASPGYTVGQVRQAANLQFTITSSNPTVGPTTTSTQTQPPPVSSSSMIVFNVALFFIILAISLF